MKTPNPLIARSQLNPDSAFGASGVSAWSVFGVKSFIGREGHGFNANLLLDGRKVAFVIDSANGGEFDFQWIDERARAQFRQHVAALPPDRSPAAVRFFPDGMPASVDSFVSSLVEAVEQERQYRGWCRTKVCFRLVGDKEGTYRTIKGAYDARIRAWLESNYAGRLEVVLNEKYGKAVEA